MNVGVLLLQRGESPIEIMPPLGVRFHALVAVESDSELEVPPRSGSQSLKPSGSCCSWHFWRGPYRVAKATFT